MIPATATITPLPTLRAVASLGAFVVVGGGVVVLEVEVPVDELVVWVVDEPVVELPEAVVDADDVVDSALPEVVDDSAAAVDDWAEEAVLATGVSRLNRLE